MSQEGGESGGLLENHAEDVTDQENEQLNLNNVIDWDLPKENGFPGETIHPSYSHDELVQMVVELNFQKEYMKSQYEGLKNYLLDSKCSDQQKVQENDNSGSTDDVKELRGEIESLKREILEERQTRGAAEEALKHLRAAHSEADINAQVLSAKLAEAQQKMDQEIKERDEKYSELDSKFNRLHKRAKQRIQEVQKEKDDLEAQLREVNEKADLTSSQLSALQQELERTRQHANEALKAMDVERQQLRSANNKLRDSIEELSHSLVPKENALEAMQQSLLEKEQQVEDMKAQIADVLAERSRATETISSLREKEKEGLEAALQSMRSKLEISESNRIHAEVEAAKLRSQLESELSVQTQLLNSKDAELGEAKDKDAEREILLVSAEKDKAIQDLKDALTNSEKEISTRDSALSTLEQQIKNLQLKLDSALSTHQSDKEAWDRSLQNVEETWRLRCEALERQSKEYSGQNLQKEVEELKLQCKILKTEYRDDITALQKQEAPSSSASAAEQQILILARQQAQREEELAQTQRHILALQEEIEELEHENRLHRQQEAKLKEELRNMERTQKREGVDLTYLKNVILKLLETGEVERLLPVIAMLLQFSPDEVNLSFTFLFKP
ncbi:UNVERIFIED_CONTAM: protein GRIP [Sesamum angustifolium]|uniref:Protein GRIP n=1 Tax=Sesamum angustifolium TaxID=2727405 RepID=A0AAW2RKL2_9LAMI